MTGISIASYARLERGLIRNPPLGWLVNAGIVLGLYFEDLLEEEMTDWHPLAGVQEAPSDEWRDRPEVKHRAERFRVEQEDAPEG